MDWVQNLRRAVFECVFSLFSLDVLADCCGTGNPTRPRILYSTLYLGCFIPHSFAASSLPLGSFARTSYKLKVAATDRERYPGKYNGLLALGINYLYRYGTLIVFANYLLEMRIGYDQGLQPAQEGDTKAKAVQSFPKWLEQRREIRTLLGRRSLD